MSLEMLREGWVAPTLNLDRLDERCAPLDYVRSRPRALSAEIVMSNNFAFGGVSTSLLFRRWPET
jgi:3-oxoacyl-[acyl-carrier-protein] synthase II